MWSTLYALLAAKKTFYKLSSCTKVDILFFIVIVCIHFLHLFVFQQSYFIGISRSTSNGNTFVYSEFAYEIKFGAWGAHEPNNANGNEDCVVLNDNNGKWFDINCDTSMRYICEYRDAGKN